VINLSKPGWNIKVVCGKGEDFHGLPIHVIPLPAHVSKMSAGKQPFRPGSRKYIKSMQLIFHNLQECPSRTIRDMETGLQNKSGTEI
jgi:hypothetical protein